MRKIIFIGGIHGVGKTYLCNSISKQINISHYSASNLIRQQKNELVNENKMVDDIKVNQDTLILGIKNSIPDGESFILDGHFCILNINGNIERIPRETFENLNPASLVIIIDDVEKIKSRLEQRDGKIYLRETLDFFQQEEVTYAKQLAIELGIELLIYNNSNNEDKLLYFLKNII